MLNALEEFPNIVLKSQTEGEIRFSKNIIGPLLLFGHNTEVRNILSIVNIFCLCLAINGLCLENCQPIEIVFF